MNEEFGLLDENENIILPPLLNLNSSSLAFSDGIFSIPLLDLMIHSL